MCSVKMMADLERELVEHAERVKRRAEELRERGVSYRLLMVAHKPRWEREALRIAR